MLSPSFSLGINYLFLLPAYLYISSFLSLFWPTYHFSLSYSIFLWETFYIFTILFCFYQSFSHFLFISTLIFYIFFFSFHFLFIHLFLFSSPSLPIKVPFLSYFFLIFLPHPIPLFLSLTFFFMSSLSSLSDFLLNFSFSVFIFPSFLQIHLL